LASGLYSHAGGIRSKAYGTGDFVHGVELVSPDDGIGYRTIFGRYNESDESGEKRFQLGAGTEGNRKDLFYITNNGAYCPDFIANNDGKEIKLSETKISFIESQDGRTYTFK
jgi:hypothetical protein